MALPKRLDVVTEEIQIGMIIRHQTDDYNAIVLDYGSFEGRELMVVAFLDDHETEESGRDIVISDYKIVGIPPEEYVNWMALCLGGGDCALGTGE